jgi:hypothetical protein
MDKTIKKMQRISHNMMFLFFFHSYFLRGFRAVDTGSCHGGSIETQGGVTEKGGTTKQLF